MKKSGIIYRKLSGLFGLVAILFMWGCSKESKMEIKSIHADGMWLRDREGRVVILRGINAGGDSKIPPFEPFPTEASAEQIKSWGMNGARYVTVWEGIEPENGIYNDAYLDRMEEIVNWFTSRGIYVFIDMHQDLFSRKFCGDGAPEWAALETTMEYRCGQNWFTYYPTEAVTKSFTRFWTDEELQSHFIEAFRRVARRFKTNDLVFGYEIFNEPWHGEFDYLSGEFEENYLAPFYRKVIQAIRKEDPGAVVLFEPAVLAGGLFLTQSKLPPLGEPNLVYSPHYYPLGALLGTEPDIDRAIQGIDDDLKLVLEKANELRTPAILGEFGAHPSQPDGEKLIRGYYEKLDKYMMGGTIWTYAPRDMEWNQEGMSLVDSELNERPYVNVVIRPYPKAISGIPVEFGFTLETKRFYLSFEESGISAPSVIYVPKRVYNSGFNVQVSDGTYEFDESKEELYYYHDSSQKNHRIEITE
jgi:endoglycosylceramidase